MNGGYRINEKYLPVLSSSTSTDGHKKNRYALFRVANGDPWCGVLKKNTDLVFSKSFLSYGSSLLRAERKKMFIILQINTLYLFSNQKQIPATNIFFTKSPPIE